MGNQLVLRRLPTALSHDVFTKTLCLEDVLVSAVFGALAYGPPAMFEAWLRRFASWRYPSPGLRPEFWPTDQRTRRFQREPDVFILDEVRNRALIVEAKRGPLPRMDLLAKQLIEEAQVARRTHPGVRMHLLLVSEHQSAPLVFAEVRGRHPRLYGQRMKHATWADLCSFLRAWMKQPECDTGHRRMIEDALGVMAKYGWG